MNLARSSFAIILGLAVTVALSVLTDMAMIRIGLFGPNGTPVNAVGFPLAALYRCLFEILGCWVAARIAPVNPMRHAVVLGGIGFVLAGLVLATAIAAGSKAIWYPAVLVVTALPCAWLGGWIEQRRNGR
jgi:hypothetical protein